MKKEQILTELTDLILTLKKKVKLFDRNADEYNPDFVKKWSEKQRELTKIIEELNSCDSSWLNDEYGKWAKKNLAADWEKVKISFQNNTEWGK